jgi:TolB-like protein
MGAGTRNAVYGFEGFTLDLVRGALLGPDGAERPLRPKSFALLRHMVENAGRLIEREEILEAVWPGLFVTEDSIGQCLKDVRRALGDDAQRLLRTLPRRGCIFAAEVSRLDAASPLLPRDLAALLAAPLRAAPQAEAPPPAAAPEAEGRPQPQRAARPMLVVLPFANMTGDPEQEYFADGITEDLTTALSHMRWFSVIARNSAFTYKGRAVDVRQVGRELGVGYVLEGSVRRTGGRVRITAQMVETEGGRHVWADRFDGDVADIFELQDRVTDAVAGAIEPSLRNAEIERTRSRPTGSLTAYDLYLRALPQRLVVREGNDEALGLLRRAIALDPGFTAAKGAFTGAIVLRYSHGWATAAEVAEGLRCARDVAEGGAGEDDPTALAWAGHGLTYFTKDHNAGYGAVERAVLLAPNSAMVLMLGGWNRTYVGDAPTAIARIERAIRLSPLDPAMFYLTTALGYALFAGGRYAEAAECAQRAARERPTYLVAHRVLAASLAQAGRPEQAREAVRGILALAPGYTVAAARAHTALRDPALFDGLRMAGLPE